MLHCVDYMGVSNVASVHPVFTTALSFVALASLSKTGTITI